MSTVRKLAKNTGWLMASQLVTNFLAFFWTILIARYLGVDGFGLLSAALAATGILGIFADLGLGTYTTREVARNPAQAPRLLGNIIIIKIILSTIIIGVILASLQLLEYPLPEGWVYALIGGYAILSSFSTLFYGLYQAHERMEFQAIGLIINSIMLFVGFILCIYLQLSVVAFGAVYLITSFITMIYTLFLTRWKFEAPAFEVNLSYWKKTIILALPFGVTSIFTLIYFWIDTVMLTALQGNAATGLYNASYKLIMVLLSIYHVYMIAIFPVMAKYYKKSPQSLKLTYHRSVKYILIIIIPVAIGTTFLARDIISLVYTSEFLPSIMALQILIWAVVFMFVNGLSTNLLGSIDKQLTVSKITAIGATFNILANLIFIPYLSFIGASITTVSTEIIIFVLFGYIVSKTGYSLGEKTVNLLWRILIPNLIMIGVLVFVPVSLVPMIIICTVVYFTAIFLIGAVDETDINIIKSVFRKQS
ncbi:MAG: flippase [Euryarchaeota archaeon]|nr:flippase [Euryarchaeota archaeon]MBU4607660.1 flippase [Euryarchaeota archaeon]MBV1755832.1 flippase [Methanobacterium sp.]